MKNFLLIMIFLSIEYVSGFGQLNSKIDTVKFVGERNVKRKLFTSNNKSYITLKRDSTYEKNDFYSNPKSLNNSKPYLTTGFWIKKKKSIYFYSSKDFDSSKWTSLYKVRKNSLKYLWRRKSSESKKNRIRTNRNERFDKIFGMKPVAIYKEIK